MDAKQGLRYDKVDFERIRGVHLSTFLHYVDVLSLALRYSLTSHYIATRCTYGCWTQLDWIFLINMDVKQGHKHDKIDFLTNPGSTFIDMFMLCRCIKPSLKIYPYIANIPQPDVIMGSERS